MPARPARLNLIHSHTAHTPIRPSLLSNHAQPRSPSTPLTPPPRLHLRSVLPSPPITPDRLLPAPSFPYPWLWRCHLCHSTYRLGATRRCLEDGHYFCVLPSSPVASSPARRKSRKEIRGCRAEFDYVGWARYNAWRREVRIVKMESRAKEWDGIYREGRDCWRDCDFPSECYEFKSGLLAMGSNPLSAGTGTAALKNAETLLQVEVVGRDEAWKDLVSDSVWDEDDEDEDEDEEEDLMRRRKKSLQKIQQLTGITLITDIPLVAPTEMPESPPSSPLKMFVSVDEEDLEEGIVWDIEMKERERRRGSSDSVASIDSQLHELMQARSLFLRNFDDGDDDSGDVQL